MRLGLDASAANHCESVGRDRDLSEPDSLAGLGYHDFSMMPSGLRPPRGNSWFHVELFLCPGQRHLRVRNAGTL